VLFSLITALSVNASYVINDNCVRFNQSDCSLNNDCSWDTEKDKCCRNLEVDWPSSPTGSTLSSCTSVTGMIKYAYDWGITLGGLAAFVSLVLAGFQYLTSVGQEGKMREAKERINSAFFGLILLFSSWLILNTINPELTVLRTPEAIEKIPLPNIPGLDILSLSDCSFAETYSGTNFTGRKTRISTDKSSPTSATPLSYIIYQEVTEKEELKRCEEEKDTCLFENNKYYKPGGACILELYGPSPFWSFAGCGDKIGSLGASVVDSLETYKESAGSIACVKLIKINTGF